MTTLTESAAGTWTLDKVHSNVGFVVQYMGVSTFRARFEDYDAQLTVNGEPKLVGTVRADSLIVKEANILAHLRSEDFFDTATYPELRFESVDVRQDGDRIVVDGELTIKRHTKRVRGEGTVRDPLESPFGHTVLGLDIETVVDRRDFGLDWNMPLRRPRPRGRQRRHARAEPGVHEGCMTVHLLAMQK